MASQAARAVATRQFPSKLIALFDADDIHRLANASGLPIKSQASHDTLARNLTMAFLKAEFATVAEVPIPNPGDLRKFYNEVSDAARTLLRALGFTGEPTTLLSEISEQRRIGEPPGLRNLSGMLLEHQFRDLWESCALSLSAEPQRAARPENAAAAIKHNRFGVLWNALSATPAAIALLASLAETHNRAIGGIRAAPGAPPERFRESLFLHLAECFHEMFGCAPRTGRDKADDNADSLMWLSAVIHLASERALKRGADEVMQSEIRSAHELTPATKAKRLADGWLAAAGRKSE